MSDEDMIRRGDAIELARKQCLLSVDDLRTLPAVQVSPDAAALVAERDELRAKLGSAMDALGYYAVPTSCDSLFARAVLARVKGGAA